MTGHAEIAGAGIAGGTAIMLARRGWTVRVHERSPKSESLNGIQIKNNAIEVLEALGIFDRLAPQDSA
jgi:2-polyprenyl-6-methoxyphenol hydroxylase-like FAD-dependent oxidoreductase